MNELPNIKVKVNNKFLATITYENERMKVELTSNVIDGEDIKDLTQILVNFEKGMEEYEQNNLGLRR